MMRPSGPAGRRRRVEIYGCAYHQKRGPPVCTNAVVIKQKRLDAAVLEALAEPSTSGPSPPSWPGPSNARSGAAPRRPIGAAR